MIEITLAQSQQNPQFFDPVIRLHGKNQFDAKSMASIIFLLYTGSYASKMYEKCLSLLPTEKMEEINDILNNLMSMVGKDDISNISELAEVEAAKRPIINSNQLMAES